MLHVVPAPDFARSAPTAWGDEPVDYEM